VATGVDVGHLRKPNATEQSLLDLIAVFAFRPEPSRGCSSAGRLHQDGDQALLRRIAAGRLPDVRPG
jgi:hypothetical protein